MSQTPADPQDPATGLAGEYSIIWVCQGPPRCELEGDDALKAQQNGCVWCKQICIDEAGFEHYREPGTA